MKILSFIGLMFASVLLTGGPESVPISQKMVRIALLQNADTFTLSVAGQYWLEDPASQKIIDKGRALRNVPVHAQKNGIRIGDKLYRGLERIKILPMTEAMVTAKGKARRYRGTIDVYSQSGTLLVVNTLDLETYIKGVLYHEISHRWPLEAMKAQAVAARTYALYQMQMNKNKHFDVTNDTYSQVYGGRSAERYRTNLAVQRTAGMILQYNGKILPTYFHATCGGHTENAAELWKHDLAPLKGGDCKYCELSPHYTWKKNFRSKDVQEKLVAQGYKIGLIKDIKVIDRNASGRVKMLQIVGRDGSALNISGKDFRQILGPNIIKSTKYDVEMQGYYFDVIGHGWGHGVGLCQWGAHFMSRERFDFEEILEFYYPGAELVDYREMEGERFSIRK